MTRAYTRIPQDTPIKINKKTDENIITQIRAYKLITPLFGGGAETQKPDEVTTVRATEVRGHLRFWWRATRGGQEKFEGKLEKMKAEEERIWGSAAGDKKAGASKVRINIISAVLGTKKDEQKQKNGDKIYHIGDPRVDWGYVAFPLRDKKGAVYENSAFNLEISYPNDENWKDDVETALWAWETFGGIGARTRRGFGALQFVKEKKSDSDQWEDAPSITKSQLQEKINENIKTGAWDAGIPHLNIKKIKILSSLGKNPYEVWEAMSKKLKDFRQNRYGNNGQGRSKWPEPDSIRQILKDKGKYKFGTHVPRHSVKNRFPRAKFGLPIRFEFPVLRNKPNPHDPETITLQGKKLSNGYIDRLASPLLLRPVQCADGVIGVAVVLDWKPIDSNEPYTPPGGLTLSGKSYGDIPFPVKSDLIVDEKKGINEAKDIPPLKGNPDVLQAFLNFLEN